jgi:hypothetical protein
MFSCVCVVSDTSTAPSQELAQRAAKRARQSETSPLSASFSFVGSGSRPLIPTACHAARPAASCTLPTYETMDPFPAPIAFASASSSTSAAVPVLAATSDTSDAASLSRRVSSTSSLVLFRCPHHLCFLTLLIFALLRYEQSDHRSVGRSGSDMCSWFVPVSALARGWLQS